MTDKTDESPQEPEPSIVDVGEEIMRIYVTKLLGIRLPQVCKEMQKHNVEMDPEYMDQRVKNMAMEYVEEAALKFNSIAMLLIDMIAVGRIGELRDFESKFVDLMERTLLKGKGLSPTIVLSLSNDLLRNLGAVSNEGDPPSDE